MKTTISKINLTAVMLVLLMAANLFAVRTANASQFVLQNDDTTSYVTVAGKVVDKETGKPVMFANVLINGTNIGTVANSEGEFLLKVPKSKSNEKILISHLGYKNYSASVNQIKSLEKILLEVATVQLKEITVRSEEPAVLFRSALKNISENYRNSPSMVTGFYRETIQQNRKYVSIAEAVLETYKVSYTNYFGEDRVKVLIGRKGQDVKKMDTLLVKLQGGPVTPFYLDIVKNPDNIFSDEHLKHYTFALAGQVYVDDKLCYVVEFKQNEVNDIAVYDGKVYITVDKLAIAALEINVSEMGLPRAGIMFIKKKPLTLRMDVTSAQYYVKYTESDGKWNLSYVRSEVKYKCKWAKKLFSSNYTTRVEMAVTDIDTANVSKFKSNEIVKSTDIFSDKAESFRNDEFWGEYNIIKPEESIQSAIEKLNKKLKKK